MSYEIDLGSWGADLDDAAFGRALAALGVGLASARADTAMEAAFAQGADEAFLRRRLDARPTTPWDVTRVLAETPAERERLARRNPAGPFAAAWADVVGQPWAGAVPRLAIERFTDEVGRYAWLTDQLFQPAAYAAAFALATELRSQHRWEWPLRIALLDDAMAKAVDARLHPKDWAIPVRRPVRPTDMDGVDLLILPQAIPDALKRLARLRDPIDVGCVVILGGLGGDADLSVAEILRTASDRTEAWGVAITTMADDAVDAWLAALVKALADDLTFDLALRQSLAGSGRGFLFAEPESLASSVFSNAASPDLAGGPAGSDAEDLAEAAEVEAEGPILAEPLPVDVADFGIDADGGGGGGMGAGGGVGDMDALEPAPRAPAPGLDLGEEIAVHARPPAPTVRQPRRDQVKKARRPSVKKARRPERPAVEPRFIQVEIRDGPDFTGRPLRRRLVADTTYGIDVWVGPETGAIHGGAPLPEEDLPKERTVRLTVVFAELDGDRRTQTATIDLPPAGAAPPHRFGFRTTRRDTFRARIIMSYKNRILQTALLIAPVVAAAAAAAPKDRIVLRTEASVRPGLAELAGRRPFGAALVHNHDERGVAGGTALRGAKAVPLELGDIGHTVDTITSLLSAAAEDPAAYGPTLEADATVGLLFKLAHQGVLLHDDLLGRPSVAALLDGAERIQIVTADPNAILPLEFVYDLPAPARPPKLCPNAKQALHVGRCDDRHHHIDDEGNLDVVCPSGFWAMSRVIERHIADPDALARAGGLHFQLASEPITGRDRLAGLTGAVFAASARVDGMVAGSAALVETALTETTGGHATRAKTWSDWVKTVKASKPSLLVLLAHSVRDDVTAMTALEIETDQRRDAAEFTTRYLHPDDAISFPPIVFLLGCDTAIADLQYQTFVTRFRQLGAALVVGTISTVAGSHAAGVAAALVRAVKREDESGWLAFGDLLRDVRRGLLSDGEVMALCLTAYGDADWRFPGGRSPETGKGEA